jgi:hypothetical protein
MLGFQSVQFLQLDPIFAHTVLKKLLNYIKTMNKEWEKKGSL